MVLDGLKLLTADEVAGILQVSEKTVYRLALAGTIPAFREGRIVRFMPDDVEAYIRGRREGKRNGVAPTKPR